MILTCVLAVRWRCLCALRCPTWWWSGLSCRRTAPSELGPNTALWHYLGQSTTQTPTQRQIRGETRRHKGQYVSTFMRPRPAQQNITPALRMSPLRVLNELLITLSKVINIAAGLVSPGRHALVLMRLVSFGLKTSNIICSHVSIF